MFQIYYIQHYIQYIIIYSISLYKRVFLLQYLCHWTQRQQCYNSSPNKAYHTHIFFKRHTAAFLHIETLDSTLALCSEAIINREITSQKHNNAKKWEKTFIYSRRAKTRWQSVTCSALAWGVSVTQTFHHSAWLWLTMKHCEYWFGGYK